MEKSKEYIKNTIILMVGKISTQLISLILLPLYTHYLLSTDYGMIDLIQTYISLFVPVLILRFDSSVFRFLIDERNRKNNDGKKIVITNTFFVLLIMVAIFSIVAIPILLFLDIQYKVLMFINIIVLMFSTLLLQVARGIGKNIDYAIACILTSVTTIIINLVLILGFKSNASCILIASSVSNLICSIYLAFRIKLFIYLDFKKLSKEKIKDMLKYSLPMIPNGLSWWVVNISDRTIISIALGVGANGIYSVSCKFSNLINNLFSVFNMSWQENASLYINDDDKNEYFSTMINQILMLFTCITLMILMAIPIAFDILIGDEYASSYNYIPILLLANIFNVLISLIGGIYIAKKMTKQTANTTIVSAIINLITNLAMIKFIGLYAACVSTLIAYVSMAIYRYIDIKRYVDIKLNYKNILLSLLIFGICSVIYYIKFMPLSILGFVLVCLFTLIINMKVVKMMALKIKNICRVRFDK